MSFHKGTATTTILVAAVAVLGTALFFVTGHSLPTTPPSPSPNSSAQSGEPQKSGAPSVTAAVPLPTYGYSPQASTTTPPPSESIQVTNGHTWISTAGTSVTAFAIQNTGGGVATIHSISVRGLPAPDTSWYSCAPTTCGTSTNINTDLGVNYNPAAGVVLGDGVNYPMTAGPISLTPGQATIVYVPGAGNIQPIDGGNTYSLQVVADRSTAVLQLQVIMK